MSYSHLPLVHAEGLLLLGDPHFADTPPGQRLDGYLEQILAKVSAGMDMAAERNLLPVFLGDLFHWPRDNSNRMLVALMQLFGAYAGERMPWTVVGNHDKYQSRFTEDVSLAVLETAGVLRLMKEQGPQCVLQTKAEKILVCSSPDGSPIPSSFKRSGDAPRLDDPQTVIWLTHHNIRFPEFQEKAYSIKELPGIDWVINGHIHRPQQTIRAGKTIWANPGNIARLTFSRQTAERIPKAYVWIPGCSELEPLELPHLPFSAVFPDQAFPEEATGTQQGDSQFITGLERLAWRRTHEGIGLRDFLEDNLDRATPEDSLVWDLYEEVVGNE